MALVILPVNRPAILNGQQNGKLPLSILDPTAGLAGGPTVRLVPTAARCWRAMTAKATADGITLQATSSADSYRTYQQQVNMFTSRYQLEPTNNGYQLWDSDGNGVRERWYKKDDVDTAAVPGDSNHGWALAIDVANASGARLEWLDVHAVAYGFSWETLPSEPWHIRNVTGDNIPPAVLAYEQEHEMTPEQAAALDNCNRYLFGLTTMQDTVQVHPGNDPTVPLATVQNAAVQTIKRIAAEVGLDPADLAAIALAAHDGAFAGAAEGDDAISDAGVDRIAVAVVDERRDGLAD